MAVYKPTRKGEASKYYVCEFVYQGKRFQESTGYQQDRGEGIREAPQG